jgi:hypothetical protein
MWEIRLRERNERRREEIGGIYISAQGGEAGKVKD